MFCGKTYTRSFFYTKLMSSVLEHIEANPQERQRYIQQVLSDSRPSSCC